MEIAQHPFYPRLAHSERELAELLTVRTERKHYLPPIANNILIVAAGALELKQLLIVTPNSKRVDEWAERWIFPVTPATATAAVAGAGTKLRIIDLARFEEQQSTWQQERFDLVILDWVACDWAEELGRRVWRVLPENHPRFEISALGEFALDGALPFVPAVALGPRQRLSALSERTLA